MERVTVTITLDDKKITMEGPEDFVRGELDRLTGATAKTKGFSDSESIETEKALIQAKQPKRHHDIIAVLAFHFLQQGKVEFTPEEIRKAYIRAGVKPPKVIDQALRDANRHHDLVEPGTTRGTFKLSHHGERVVRFELPRRDKE
ncbi:MAG: hypothetical protein ACJ71U_02805 [Terriglobales bacterium]|jgi:hypothetical protein